MLKGNINVKKTFETSNQEIEHEDDYQPIISSSSINNQEQTDSN